MPGAVQDDADIGIRVSTPNIAGDSYYFVSHSIGGNTWPQVSHDAPMAIAGHHAVVQLKMRQQMGDWKEAGLLPLYQSLTHALVVVSGACQV